MTRSSGGGSGDPHTGQDQGSDGRNPHFEAAAGLGNKAMSAAAAGKRDHGREKWIAAPLRGGRKGGMVPSACCFLRKPLGPPKTPQLEK